MKISNNEKIIGWNEDKIAGWIGRVAYLGCGVKEAFSEKINAESGMTRVQMFEKKKHSSQKEPSTQGPWGKISLIHRMNKSSEGQSSIGKGERMDEVIWRGRDRVKCSSITPG